MTAPEVKTYFFTDQVRLPLVMERSASADLASAVGWLASHRPEIAARLRETGAILFRNFPVVDATDFETFATALDSKIMQYKAGTSDRERVSGNVHTSTSMPAYFKLALHHEMAYRKKSPDGIFFFCAKAPLWGGETTIADGRKIFRELSEAVREKFTQQPVRFERKLLNAASPRRWYLKLSRAFRMMSWQRVFKTDEPKQVEEILKAQGYEFEWSKRGDLNFWNDLNPVTAHPETREPIWFRPVHFFHFSARVYGRFFYSLARMVSLFTRRPLPRLRFADGSAVEERDLNAVVDVLESNEVYFKWKTGDVLYLDNRMVAHGRNRYFGAREILVLMTGEG
ncbi:MAG: TauD/TfdA family dioxygenase [Bdellovibrionia bacterium]